MSIYISVAAQNQVFRYFHFVFVFALILNIAGLVFLIKITPPKQSVIQKNLIVIQATLILIDANFDVGLCPIFLFPAPAGYASGILMQLGVSAHVGFALVLLFYVWMGAAIVWCVLFRHQSILPDGSVIKISKKRLQFLQLLSGLACSVFYIIYMFNGRDSADVERILNEANDPHNLTWIRDRGGSYYITERTPKLTYGILIGISIMISSGVHALLMFFHMFHLLQKDQSKRSEQSRKLIRRSIVNLFFQIFIPFTFFSFPAITILLGIAFEDWLSFEASFTLFLMLPWHSIGHNVLLLTITKSYRQYIIFTFCRAFRQDSVFRVAPEQTSNT